VRPIGGGLGSDGHRVSGKGVSSALLAALLQGAFLLAGRGPGEIARTCRASTASLNERTQGEKYATVFYCTVERNGLLGGRIRGIPSRCWCGAAESLPHSRTTGLRWGCSILRSTAWSRSVAAGDKVVAFRTVVGAEMPRGSFSIAGGCGDVEGAMRGWMCGIAPRLMESLDEFTDGAVLSDDVTPGVTSIRRGKNEGADLTPIKPDLWAATLTNIVMWLVMLRCPYSRALATILAIIMSLKRIRGRPIPDLRGSRPVQRNRAFVQCSSHGC